MGDRFNNIVLPLSLRIDGMTARRRDPSVCPSRHIKMREDEKYNALF